MMRGWRENEKTVVCTTRHGTVLVPTPRPRAAVGRWRTAPLLPAHMPSPAARREPHTFLNHLARHGRLHLPARPYRKRK